MIGRRPCARTPSAGIRSRARCPRTCVHRRTNTRPRYFRAPRRSRYRRFRLASGDGMPGISLHGRMFTYWSKPRRNWISEPTATRGPERWRASQPRRRTSPRIPATGRTSPPASCGRVWRNSRSSVEVRERESMENFRALLPARADLRHDFLAMPSPGITAIDASPFRLPWNRQILAADGRLRRMSDWRTPRHFVTSAQMTEPGVPGVPMNERNYWIGVVSRDHVAIGVDGGFTQLNHARRRRWKNARRRRLRVLFSAHCPSGRPAITGLHCHWPRSRRRRLSGGTATTRDSRHSGCASITCRRGMRRSSH